MHILLIVIAVIVLVLIAIGLYVGYPLYNAIQVSKGIQTQAMPYEQHPANPTKYILVAGDSTAVGTGALDSKKSTAGLLGALYPAADITNLGVNGFKLDGLITALESAPRAHYDLILIQIGANDVVGFTPLNKVNTELETVLGMTDKLGTKTVVITAGNIGLSPVFHFPLSQLMTWRMLEVRKIFIAGVAEHPAAQYVDLFNEKLNREFETDIPKYYAADYFHPSADGYALWFQEIKPYVVY